MSQPREVIQKMLAMFAECYRQEVSRGLLAIYVDALDGLTAQEVETAAKRAMRELKWFPKPAELRELARPKQEQIPLSVRALRAWDLCQRHLDYYKTIEFDDPIIHATVRALGDVEVIQETEPQFIRPQFLKMYEAFATTGIDEDQAGPLIGWLDRENNRLGYTERRQPVLRISTGLPALPCVERLTSNRRPESTTAPGISFKELPGDRARS